MKFIENQNPLFTEKHLDHIERYRDAYGQEFFSEETMKYERSRLEQGNPSRRVSFNGKVYELWEADEHIGDIVLILNDLADFGAGQEKCYEMDLAIFHPYSGKGYGKRALQEFVEYYKANYPEPLEAIIINANPVREKVEHLFESVGFVQDGTLGDLAKVYRLVNA